MDVQTQTLKSAVEVDPSSACVVILIPQNLLDVEIMGRKSLDWVKIASEKYETKTVEIKRGDDIVGVVKNAVADTSAKYCVVVYADTPLVTSATIEQSLSFIATYYHRAVQLPRGWVFDIDFVKSAGNVQAVIAPNLDPVDFTIAYNFAQIGIITSHARMRINDFHMANDVHIVDPYGTYIDANVKIGKGTFIGANCNIIGDITIGENAHIEHGSTITSDVPANALALSRARQAVKENFRDTKEQ